MLERCTSTTGSGATGADRVVDGDRGVGVGPGIDDDARGLVAGLVDPVDQIAFMVGLAEIDGKPELFAGGPAVIFDVGERLAAIDPRLALAQRVRGWDRSGRIPSSTCYLSLRRTLPVATATSIVGIARAGKSARGIFCCPQGRRFQLQA